MSVERIAYIDSSAIVKLVIRERETAALLRYVRGRRLVSSAIARTEVARAVLPHGAGAAVQSRDVLSAIDLVRVNDRVLAEAGALLPAEIRLLDAIHLATARLLGPTARSFIAYDVRLIAAARAIGLRVVSPA
jgi:predicted nucleic acid-binding protein